MFRCNNIKRWRRNLQSIARNASVWKPCVPTTAPSAAIASCVWTTTAPGWTTVWVSTTRSTLSSSFSTFSSAVSTPWWPSCSKHLNAWLMKRCPNARCSRTRIWRCCWELLEGSCRCCFVCSWLSCSVIRYQCCSKIHQVNNLFN